MFLKKKKEKIALYMPLGFFNTVDQVQFKFYNLYLGYIIQHALSIHFTWHEHEYHVTLSWSCSSSSPPVSFEAVGNISNGGALTSRGGALTSRDGALTSRDGALTSRGGALTSRDGALTSRDGALTSRDGALTSRDGALTSRDGALTSRDGALTSCDGALTSCDGALTLYQPMTAKAVMSSHKPVRIYMGNLILGVIL